MIKILVGLRVAGVDVGEVVQVHRRHLVEVMQQYTRLKEDLSDDEVALALVVDAELFRIDGVIRWLDAADGRLKRRAADGRAEAATATASQRHRARAVAAQDRRSAMSVLELRSVSKVYGDGAVAVRALDAVDLSVAAGDLVAVMGPSGSGKSTLLTIAGALEEPSGGDVLVNGQLLATMSPNDRARLRRRSIGYVFQDFNLLAGLTAAENVSLPLELDGVRQRRARVAATEALEQLGVADKADRFPDDLSGGERQRVAIARAVVGDRRLLLADEPTGALDSANGESVMRLLRAACQRGVAGVVVTHDAQLASWADRVVFLRDGRVVDQTAAPSDPSSLLPRPTPTG